MADHLLPFSCTWGGGPDSAPQLDASLAFGGLGDGEAAAFVRARGGREDGGILRVAPSDLAPHPFSAAPPISGPLFRLSLSAKPALVVVGCATTQVMERAPLGELTLPARGEGSASSLQVQVFSERPPRWVAAATDPLAAAGSGTLLPPIARTGFASAATQKRVFVFGGITRSSLLAARERVPAGGRAAPPPRHPPATTATRRCFSTTGRTCRGGATRRSGGGRTPQRPPPPPTQSGACLGPRR